MLPAKRILHSVSLLGLNLAFSPSGDFPVFKRLTAMRHDNKTLTRIDIDVIN